MNYLVRISFYDKFTNKYYPIGSVYKSDKPDRVKELQNGNYIGESIKNEDDLTSQKPTGKQKAKNVSGGK